AKRGGIAGRSAGIWIGYKFKGDPQVAGNLDRDLSHRLLEVARGDRFDGRGGRRLLWHTVPPDGFKCRRFLLLGLGAKDELTLERFRRYLGDALVEWGRPGAADVGLPL